MGLFYVVFVRNLRFGFVYCFSGIHFCSMYYILPSFCCFPIAATDHLLLLLVGCQYFSGTIVVVVVVVVVGACGLLLPVVVVCCWSLLSNSGAILFPPKLLWLNSIAICSKLCHEHLMAASSSSHRFSFSLFFTF